MAATKTKQKGKKTVKKMVANVAKKKRGAPSLYTQSIADKICEATAVSSKSLKTICQGLKLKPMTVLQWLRNNEDFSKMYARAKEEQADLLAEEIISISEHTKEDHTPFTGGNVVRRDQLRIDARKWVAAKLKPRKYGDKLDVEHSGNLAIQWQEQKTYEAKPKTDESA